MTNFTKPTKPVLIVAKRYDWAQEEAGSLGYPIHLGQTEWYWGNPLQPRTVAGMEFSKIIWDHDWDVGLPTQRCVDAKAFFLTRLRS